MNLQKNIIGLTIFLFLIALSMHVSYGQVSVWTDDFETDKGWTFVSEFERGTPAGGTGDHGNANPTSAYNGSNSIGTDLDGAYPDNLPDRAYTAISPVIDCSDYANLTLNFQRWLNLEENQYDKGYIDITVDGGTEWTNIWTNPSATIEDNSWSLQSISLPTSIDNNANLQIRFSLGTTDGGWYYSGWNIDDIEITGYYTTNVITHDFNSSDNGWTISSGWIRDNSSFTGSDGNHWHITPFNNYSDNVNSTITSEVIDLSSKTNLLLQFDLRYFTEADWDGLNIEYYDGSTWSVLGAVGEGTNWYNDADVDGIGNNIDGWSDNNTDWETVSIELPAALENNANVQFRFNFGSDGNTNEDGVAFDNFTINEYTTTPPTPPQTWYAYSSSGNWSDASSWTLDGATNPLYVNSDSDVPASTDYVVIPSGKKITIQSTTNTLSVQKIEVNGELDVTSSHSHDFNVINGNGTILMQGYDFGSGVEDNFPDGTATLFIDSTVGGTVELYGTGISLNQARTFNNLTVNLTSGSATISANYTLNGNLTVENSNFKVNDNSNTTPLKLSVAGNVNVESNGTITVGTANAVDGTADNGYGNYHKYYHQFAVSGDFTNQGSVRLTNLTNPDYDTRASGGAVSLIFDGSTNNTFSCQGTTDLYYLVISKGTNQTYGLTINATDKSYFSLFGDNNADWDETDTENPENRKALWIEAGSLILEGYVYIPTLTEDGRPYVVGHNAALILNSSNVFVSSTAISAASGVHSAIDYTDLSYSSSDGINNTLSNSSIYIYGSIIVNDGTLETSNSQGLLYRAESSANSLQINGGLVRTGQFRISSYADAATAKMSYYQSGGELKLIDNYLNDVAIFDLSAQLGSFTMKGGTISINDLSTNSINAIEIGCPENNINITGGTIVLDNPSGENAIATISTTAPFHNFILRENQDNGIQLSASLEINNDLEIEAEDFNANGNDLYIGSDLKITSGATYTTGSNTTIFNGSKKTSLYLPALQIFNNLTVTKTVDEKDFIIASGLSTAFQVNGEFRIEKGIFDYGEYSASLKGNFFIADSVRTDNATPGKLIFDGTALQTITSESSVIQNITINNSNGISLTGDLNITDTLTLTDGVFDINTHKLTLFGADAEIAGTFGVGEMIQTDGNSSDGGLEMYLDANETLTFPIGTDSNNGGSSPTRYTPAVATFSSFNDDGYVRISIADDQIPMTIGNGGDILSYYWKVRYSNFTTEPVVTSYVFTHDDSDADTGGETSFKAGKVLDIDPYTQSTENGYDKNANTITFSAGFNLEFSSYTAGNSSRFQGAPDVYYSRQTGNYNSPSTWSKNDDTGGGTQEVPVEGSVVIIQNSNRVNVYASIDDVGVLIFEHDYVTDPTPDSENVPRLQFHISGTFNLGAVSGTGMVSFDAPDAPVVNGDFGEFGTNVESYYLYFGGNNTLNSIPTPIPNLLLESYTYLINQQISTNGDLIIQGDGTVELQQDTEIAGDLLIGTWIGGTVRLASQATAITVTINGNIDFTKDPLNDLSDRDLIVEASGSENVEHKIILKGDILHGSENGHSIDLWRSNTTERAILELQGESDNTYSRTSTSEPQFYRIIVNKGIDITNSFSFNESFTINGATNSATDKALELLNGKLIINDADIDIDLTTANPFQIPSTSALEITLGTLNANGADGGITLDGTITINGGTLDMTDASSEDNYIEYGASANALLDISSGILNVGTQIRRLSTNASGVINYNQTGGTVTIGVNTADADYDEKRGMLEVLNDGSNFTLTGGSLTIVRQNGGTPEVAALYLNPTTYDVSGSTITIGNASTPESQNSIGINSNIDLNNFTVYADAGLTDYPEVYLETSALTILGNLTANANATFNGNGLDLTIGGDFSNDGIYTANSNTTIFSSNSAQSFSGSGTEDIYNLTKTGSGTLTSAKEIIINNSLDIDQGILNTDTNPLRVKGNVTLDGTISSTSGIGIEFSGTSLQNLSRSTNGTSLIGIMTVNNNDGVKISNTGHSFSITNELRLNSGVFNIGGSLLEFGTSAIITEVESFSTSNMIQTNSSFQDNGVEKNFSAGHTTDFIFPIGQLKYTPVNFDFSSVGNTTGTNAGSITVRPANEFHPTVNDGDNFYASADINNVLQYYWILRADNMVGFASDATFSYEDTDASADEGGLTEADYIAARILTNNNVDEEINKFTTTEVDETTHEVSFNFNAVTDNGISGDYFAGIDDAIPDNVATYTSASGGGDVTDDATYTESLPTDGVAPTGAVLIISAGDEIIFNVDDVNVYKTVIQSGGTLTINETERHRLGTVTGTGDLKIVSNTTDVSFPAGDYIDFFDCTGGGLNYAGTGSYSVMSSLPSVRNLTISGTGTKELANNDIEICENFTLNGSTFDNASDNDITVNGNMVITSGEFKSGTSNIIDVAGTTTVNGGTYSAETGGDDSFGELVISSGTFNTGSGGSISIQGDFTYSGGTFNGGSGIAKIVLNGSANQNISGTFTGASEIFNIEVNNTAGITLQGNVTIDNSLTLTNGLVTPGANTLLINSNATISPSIGTSTAYINGKLSKILSSAGDDFIFPVGKSGKWGYAGVYDVTTGGLTWDVEYFASTASGEALVDNFTPTSGTITSVTETEYWKISDSGSSNANIELSWNSGSNVSADQTEREKLEVMVWNDGASTWDNNGGGSFSASHTQLGGSFLTTSTISFSENIITLGSSDANNPLPVELISFIAKANNKNIELFWSTASETNNDYFEIQRSIDAKNFNTIGTVYGSGNSNIQLDYDYVDENPSRGTNYYRLKQVDYNGDFEIHKTIAVDWNGIVTDLDSDDINIYPNPYTSGELILDLHKLEPYTSINLTIIDISGKLTYRASLLVPENQEMNIIPMAIDNLNQGIYFISVLAGNNILTKKLIVN